MPLKVIIDTDIGDDIDDALALALAVNSPEIELLGVTTVYGKVDIRAKLAAKILKEYKLSYIPIAKGFSKPLINPEPIHVPNQAKVLKPDETFSNILDNDAVSLFKEIVESEKEVYIITIGAMTNLATFILQYPELAKRIKVISMAGSVYYPRVEYNIRCDPEAARIVFDSGINITLVPLDITLRCRMDDNLLNKFYSSKKREVSLLAKYLKYWQEFTHRIPILHDPLAIAVSYVRNIVKIKSEKIYVELGGEKARGIIIPNIGSSTINVAYDVDNVRFLKLFEERVLG
ncbi:MAG: nucleoside hydrolase [Thermoproteales archaeon]|nr:nucleoside hydrolase [Thermoproteales archaeon]